MKTVKKYDSAVMAELDRTVLEDAGITATVLNGNATCYVAPLSGGLISVELAVADEDYDDAVAILNKD